MAKKRKKKSRANMSKEKVLEHREKNKTLKKKARANKSSFEGRCASCLQDVSTIQELKDTKDTIGDMEHRCKFCQALKWKKETPITCCNGGKIKLE